MQRLVGPLAASNGFIVWLAFAIQTGGGARMTWDTVAFWMLGLPLLVTMHMLLGATMRRGTLWLPACTLAGHLLAAALVHPADIAPLPLLQSAVLAALPLYVALVVAGWAGHAIATLARRTA